MPALKSSTCISLFFLLSLPIFALQDNLIRNATFASGNEYWQIHLGAVDSECSTSPGSASLRLEFSTEKNSGQAIAHQKVQLKQEQPIAFVYGCQSKAEGLRADLKPAHAVYGLELRVDFQDGSRAWISPQMTFSGGTHDWEPVSGIYKPPRAVREITFYCRLRSEGKVWFDDFFLQEVRVLDFDAMKGCRIRELGDEFIVENDFLSLTLDPGRGGSCKEFLVKANGANYSGQLHHNFRMFTDKLRVRGNTYNKVFKAEILHNTEQRCALKLSVLAPDGYPFLEMSKTFRLTKYSSALEVEYSYLNLPDSMADLVIEPYFRNGWNLQGTAEQQYLVPSSIGIQAYPCQGGDTYIKDIVAGWLGSVDGSGRGMACEFDYSHLDMFYLWLGGLDKTTAEWCFSPVKIPAGKDFSTRLSFFPVDGLKKPNNVENGIASELLVEPEVLHLDFVSSGTYLLNCVASINYADGSITRHNVYIDLLPGKTSRASLPLKDQELARLSYALYDAESMVFDAEHWFQGEQVYKPKKSKAKPAEIVPFNLEVSNAVDSPHTAWAKPYSKGTIKALVITDILHLREVVELQQRLDLQSKVIRICMSESILKWAMCDRYGVFTYADANLSLKKALESEFDVIMVSEAFWQHIDKDNIELIENKLKKGCGLVLIEPKEVPTGIMRQAGLLSAIRKAQVPEAKHYIHSGIPMSLIPYTRRPMPELASWMQPISEIAAAGEKNGCRSVVFSYRVSAGLTPVIPWKEPEPAHRYQDYSLGLLAKALIWAAHKEPELQISSINCEDANLNFSLSHRAATALSAKLILAQPGLEKRREKEFALQPEKDFSLPLADLLYPGENILDLIVSNEKGTLDWGSLICRNDQAASWQSLTLQNSEVKQGELIKGVAAYTGKTGLNMRIELLDAYGRLIDVQEQNTGKEIKFSLQLRELRSAVVFVKASLLDANTLLDLKKTELLAPHQPSHSDFPFATGDSGYRYDIRRYINPLRYERFRQAGVNEIRFWRSDGDETYRDHLRFALPFNFPVASQHLWTFSQDFAEPYAKTKDKQYLCRKPCLNDPEYLEAQREKLVNTLKRLQQYSPVSVDVGDENSLTKWSTPYDFCFSEHCLEAFRNWLKEEYASLEKLNEEWGLKFASWKDVVPLTTEESRQHSSKSRRYAAWADHRRFMELTFCSVFQTVKDVIRQMGLGLPVDMSGTQPPNGYTGMDMWLLSKCIDIPAAYDRENLAEIMRSFGRPLVKPWYGYGNDGLAVKRKVWFDAFRFKNYGISYYTSINLLMPDFTVPRQVRELNEYCRDLRDGAASLLRHFEEETEVLIHYSQHSIHAAVIEDCYADFLAARELWCKLLDDMMMSYRFVSYEEIETGQLLHNRAKILILPHSFALSPAEVKGMRDFVAKGGLLLADRYAGIMNQHCNIQAVGQLDELFGLQESDMGPSRNQELKIGQTALLAALGSARGAAPQLGGEALFLNSYGKGQALYLNMHWPQYGNLRTQPEKNAPALAYRQLLKKILSPYLADKKVLLSDKDFSFMRGFVYKLQEDDSDVSFVGLIREADAPGRHGEVEVRLEKPACVYDMRKKEFLGRRETFKVELQNADAAFYAVLPYEIEGIELLGAATVQAGQKMRLEISLHKNDVAGGGHSYKVEVFDPRGVKSELYSQVVFASHGDATVEFQTALNDKKGKWQVTATDFISGLHSSAVFDLE